MIESHARRFPGLAAADWLRVLGAAVGAGRIYREAGPSDVEAAGWLELPWAGEPHLILAGLNQGLVPESAASDPFLPDSLRERLRLACNRSRFARDAYYLARILAQRAGGAGRVDVLVGQSAGNGDPLRPSRLLFLCGADELPARVRRLFGDPEPPEPEPPWNPGWLLEPPRVALERAINVTAFASYLDCPFRFYLGFGLGMEPFEPGVSEMDARVFGTLVHAVLERFARDESIRDSADAAAIRDYVLAGLDDEAGRSFGPNLSVSLRVQIEAARRRLGAFAAEQARQRADGWRIERVEVAFHELLGREFALDGWTIRGKIDRIDRNAARGLWRVLDYKTNDTPAAPRDKHLRTPASTGFAPDYARLVIADSKGKPLDRCWANLQLPLYRHALAETGVDPGAIVCAYFNLPKSAALTSVAEWAGFDGALAGSALACARGVLAGVAAGAFWPPNPRPAYDRFGSFFPVDPAALVDAGGFHQTGAP
jgi:ATP-dependent helicase/nuclease subunit B